MQVLSTAIGTAVSSSSTSFVDVTGVSVTLTPSSASNKVLIIVTGIGGSPSNTGYFNVNRAGSNIFDASVGYIAYGAFDGSIALCYLDSPNTTSSTTYQLRFRCSAGSVRVGASNGDANNDTFITVMEVKG